MLKVHPIPRFLCSLPRFFYFGGDIISRGALIKIKIVVLQPNTTHVIDLEADEFLDKLYTAPEGRLFTKLHENIKEPIYHQLNITNTDEHFEHACALYIRSL